MSGHVIITSSRRPRTRVPSRETGTRELVAPAAGRPDDVSPATPSRPSLRIAAGLAPLVIAAVAAYPILVLPLIEPPPPPAIIADFAPPMTDSDSGLFNKIYFPALALLALLALAARHGLGALKLMTDPAIVVMGLACAWIVLTSPMAVEPEVALRRAILQLTIIVAIVGSVIAARRSVDIVHALGLTFAVALVANLWAVSTQAPTPLGYAGLYTHKNQLGAVAVVGMMVAMLWLAAPGRVTRAIALLMLPLAIGLTIAARSKTSLGSSFAMPMLALGLALLARYLRLTPALVLPLLFAAAWLVYAFGVRMQAWDFHAVAETLLGDPTLTQRTDIWAFALKMLPERPITGFGYEVFWGAGPESPSVRQGPGFVAKMPHAHNGYIDLVLQTGVVGLGLIMSLVVIGLHRAGRVASRNVWLGAGMLAVIVLSVFYNLLESAWFRTFNVMWIDFLLVIVLSSRLALGERETG